MRAGRSLALASILGGAAVTDIPALAAEDAREPQRIDWSFNGPLGKYDRGALRQGLDIYLNMCVFCHSLDYVAYRNLTEIGLTEDEAKSISAQYSVTDGPDEFGAMFERPAGLADRFVPPFPNDNAARAANGGALPPDLSLVVKARAGGANYIYSLMVGYEETPPDDFELVPGLIYNPYFAGGQTAMPPPLFDGLILRADGSNATVAEMAHDVTQFLAWAAEPRMEERKRLGLGVMIFLAILTGLLIAVKRRVWADARH